MQLCASTIRMIKKHVLRLLVNGLLISILICIVVKRTQFTIQKCATNSGKCSIVCIFSGDYMRWRNQILQSVRTDRKTTAFGFYSHKSGPLSHNHCTPDVLRTDRMQLQFHSAKTPLWITPKGRDILFRTLASVGFLHRDGMHRNADPRFGDRRDALPASLLNSYSDGCPCLQLIAQKSPQSAAREMQCFLRVSTHDMYSHFSHCYSLDTFEYTYINIDVLSVSNTPTSYHNILHLLLFLIFHCFNRYN